MHNHEIKAMADGLVKRGCITESQRASVEAGLSGHWSDRMAIVWCAADVHQQANVEGYALTDDAANTLLYQVLEDHDATVGINHESFGGRYGDLAMGVDCLELPARYKAFCANGGNVRLEQRGGRLVCRCSGGAHA